MIKSGTCVIILHITFAYSRSFDLEYWNILNYCFQECFCPLYILNVIFIMLNLQTYIIIVAQCQSTHLGCRRSWIQLLAGPYQKYRGLIDTLFHMSTCWLKIPTSCRHVNKFAVHLNCPFFGGKQMFPKITHISLSIQRNTCMSLSN